MNDCVHYEYFAVFGQCFAITYKIDAKRVTQGFFAQAPIHNCNRLWIIAEGDLCPWFKSNVISDWLHATPSSLPNSKGMRIMAFLCKNIEEFTSELLLDIQTVSYKFYKIKR